MYPVFRVYIMNWGPENGDQMYLFVLNMIIIELIKIVRMFGCLNPIFCGIFNLQYIIGFTVKAVKLKYNGKCVP